MCRFLLLVELGFLLVLLLELDVGSFVHRLVLGGFPLLRQRDLDLVTVVTT